MHTPSDSCFNQLSNTPPPVLLGPLYGQKLVLSAQERRQHRRLVWENRNDPAVIALFNLLERSTFNLQGMGIAPGSTPHDQGQACGALEVYGRLRTWLECEEKQPEEEDEE